MKIAEVNFTERSIDETGAARCKNVVAAGALLGMLGLKEAEAEGVVRYIFKGKGSDVADQNVAALIAGYDEGTELASLATDFRIESPENCRRILISGNEAAALGALVAGVRFFAGYPITPASEIMEWLATQLPKVGGTMIQQRMKSPRSG